MDGDHAGPRPDQCFAATGAMDGLVETRPCAVAGWYWPLVGLYFICHSGRHDDRGGCCWHHLILSGLAGIGGVARPLSWLGSAILLWLLVTRQLFSPSKIGMAGESAHNIDALWQPWRPGMVGPLVDAGQTVFVDVTAAWCITCQANKSLVIEQAPVAPISSSWLSLAN